MPLVLGIESSCDETAAAVVRDGRTVLSSVVHTQIAAHRPYGGVVPEIASRAHVENFPAVVAAAIEQAGMILDDDELDRVAGGKGLDDERFCHCSAPDFGPDGTQLYCNICGRGRRLGMIEICHGIS